MADDTSPSSPTLEDGSGVRGAPPRRGQIALSLAVIVAVLGGAWAVGGRQGFGQIGQAGVNQQLLPKVGDPAPDFTAYDLDGRPVSLSEFRGQPVWLNFWGSWCPPCRSEMPDIQEAYERLAPDGLVLLAVSLKEPPGDAKAFAERNHATFTILSDQFLTATGEAYPIANFPTHIFIDRDGKIQRIVLAAMDVETAVKYGREIIATS